MPTAFIPSPLLRATCQYYEEKADYGANSFHNNPRTPNNASHYLRTPRGPPPSRGRLSSPFGRGRIRKSASLRAPRPHHPSSTVFKAAQMFNVIGIFILLGFYSYSFFLRYFRLIGVNIYLSINKQKTIKHKLIF